jgi:uncharacterized protein YcbX
MTPRLARVLIYPIKSLDAVAVEQAEVLPGGALRHDRRYALVDADGHFINGKRTPLVHRLRASFDLDRGFVELRGDSHGGVFHLDGDRTALEAALSRCLEQGVRIIENAAAGFPDDLESPGPTVVSTATLRTVAGWFAGLDEHEARRRFRANLEIDAVGDDPLPPFWEDRLCGPAGQEVRFRIGEVVFAGTNPCQRCIVPTCDAATGDAWPRFAKTFAQHREAALPAWAERSRFDHFYRLAVNTRLAGAGGTIRVGDAIELLEQT